MKLHVLTAVTRPDNLLAIQDSMDVAKQKAPGVWVRWHWRYDMKREHVGGQALKNRMLDEITDGWVCVLDDDTIMHPWFLRKIWVALGRNPSTRAIVVSQQRTTGQILRASAANAVVGKIDAGQAVLRRDLIGDERIPETYAGDGMWLEKLLAGREDVHYMGAVLSLHNALSGIDVSETPERMQA